MKIVHIVTADIIGGAPKAAFALNKALQEIGINSKMLVQRKFGQDTDVFSISNTSLKKQKTNARILTDLMQMKMFTKTKEGRFSFGSIGTDITNNKLIRNSDIIHLHWINEGFLSIKSVLQLSKLNKPVVWTLHDMWGFTGGCHYSMGCKRFIDSCGDCPYLFLKSKNDSSKKLLYKKNSAYSKLNLSFITCSEWLAGVAKTSFLLNDKSVTPIHNTLDIDIYKPLDQKQVRRSLGFPVDKFLILFVAFSTTEKRKGFEYLKKSLILLTEKYPEISSNTELLILGRFSLEQLEGISLKVNTLGRINNDSGVAEYYNAADIFLLPSLEDNLPNTVLESLSCGTPVVAFNIGGIPEMIDHLKSGYLSDEKSVKSFTDGIRWAFKERKNFVEFKANGRKKVLDFFNPQKIANEHWKLYQDLIDKK